MQTSPQQRERALHIGILWLWTGEPVAFLGAAFAFYVAHYICHTLVATWVFNMADCTQVVRVEAPSGNKWPWRGPLIFENGSICCWSSQSTPLLALLLDWRGLFCLSLCVFFHLPCWSFYLSCLLLLYVFVSLPCLLLSLSCVLLLCLSCRFYQSFWLFCQCVCLSFLTWLVL